ncbi:MAG TPA: pitrilysin family protein [Blastocatellia bacterium]|nr:pitrilysin family protein [Blastocatellia bacterium]
MKRFLSTITLIAVLALGSTPATRGQTFKVPFSQFSLENGLRVILSEDHSAPVVAVAVYYDVGSRNEVKGRTGFAHLFEHMMFQGSENVRKAAHFKYVESNGGVMNAATHSDFTNYYEFLPSNQLALALWLESDRMRSLRITAANLKNQKDAVKEEKRLSYDNQAYWPALLKMDEMVFRNWANAHSAIGSMRDLDAATVADVSRFFATYYAPNNAVLAIAGDIDSSETEALVRKYFGSIPRHKPPPSVDVSEPFEVAARTAVIDDPHAQMPAVSMAWKMPARRSPDFHAIALLKSILCDGQSGRLYQKLVKERAVSLEVQGTLEARRGPGQVAVFTIHKKDIRSEDVRAIVEAEIERIKTEGVTTDELIKAKNQYRLDRFQSGSEGEYSSLQTALGRALALGEFAMFDGDPSLINTEIDRYLAVTVEQIRDVARRYFVPANTAVLNIRAVSGQAQPAAPQTKIP